MAVTVIDKTAQTDTRVYGGPMTPDGEPDGIILHHTGSKNEQGDYNWLSTFHANPVSTNQLVKRDGTIIQIVPNTRIAFHAGVSTLNGRADCNAWCIGIEICHSGKAEDPYPEAQLNAVAYTVAYNTARFKIPDKNVATHAKVALPPGRKVDPVNWDMAGMWKRVQAIRTDWPFDIPLWVCNEG